MSIGNATSGEWMGEYPNEKYVFSIKNTYVYLCEASITDVTDVDVIINATNDKLASGAGVAAVIARKAGIAVTNECSNYIRDNGNLPVTENFVSTAGYLPFKGIIHVVGPTWSNYTSRQKCAKDLFHTVINALTTARSKGWSKVAFPAISSDMKIKMLYCLLAVAVLLQLHITDAFPGYGGRYRRRFYGGGRGHYHGGYYPRYGYGGHYPGYGYGGHYPGYGYGGHYPGYGYGGYPGYGYGHGHGHYHGHGHGHYHG